MFWKWLKLGKVAPQAYRLQGDEAELPDEVYLALTDVKADATRAELNMSRVAVFHRCFLNGSFGAVLVNFADQVSDIVAAYEALDLEPFARLIRQAHQDAKAAETQGISPNDIEQWYAVFEATNWLYSELTYGGEPKDARADALEQALVRKICQQPEVYKRILLAACL